MIPQKPTPRTEADEAETRAKLARFRELAHLEWFVLVDHERAAQGDLERGPELGPDLIMGLLLHAPKIWPGRWRIYSHVPAKTKQLEIWGALYVRDDQSWTALKADRSYKLVADGRQRVQEFGTRPGVPAAN